MKSSAIKCISLLILIFTVQNLFGITLTTQNEIDGSNLSGILQESLIIDEASPGAIDNLIALQNITGVAGDLRIQGNAQLSSLEGLHNIQTVGGWLRIVNNSLLTDIMLSNLISIGGDLTINNNPSLTSLAALTALETVGSDLQFSFNDQLSDLLGLSNLTSITAMELSVNPMLSNLTGLNNLVNVQGYLLIADNLALTNISALGSLESVGGDFVITNNNSLQSLEGVSNLTLVGISVVLQNNISLFDLGTLSSELIIGNDFYLSGHPLLCACDVVLEFYDNITGTAIIENNNFGCNSYQEITEDIICCPAIDNIDVIASSGQITFQWLVPIPNIAFDISYRIGNCDNEWITINDYPNSSFDILDLTACTNYEFGVRYFCEDNTAWSEWAYASSVTECTTISGIITLDESCGSFVVPYVDMNISTPSNLCIYETQIDGIYSCDILSPGPVTVTPERDGLDLCGVSTVDIVLIQKHVVQDPLLNSNYKVIAADVNASGTVTTFDALLIRKLILMIDLEFEFVDSWEFADPSTVPNGPISYLVPPFNDFISFDSGEESLCSGGDFVAIKKGDVSCSSIVCQYIDPDFNDSDIKFSFGRPIAIGKGNNYRIPLIVEENIEVLGFQLGLSSRLEMTAIHGGNIGSFNNSNYNIPNASQALISWNNANNQAVRLNKGEVLIYVDILSNGKNGDLSSMISIDDQVMPSEFIDGQLQIRGAQSSAVEQMEYRSFSSTQENLIIFPTVTANLINIINNNSAEQTIEVFSIYGEQLLLEKIEESAQIQLNLSDFANGTYFVKNYNAGTGEFAIQKIIKTSN